MSYLEIHKKMARNHSCGDTRMLSPLSDVADSEVSGLASTMRKSYMAENGPGPRLDGCSRGTFLAVAHARFGRQA